MKTRKYLLIGALTFLLTGASSHIFGKAINFKQFFRANQLEQKVEKYQRDKAIYAQATKMDNIIREDNYVVGIPINSVPKDELVEAVIMAESSGNPNAISRMKAKGKMQIMSQTLREYNKRHKTNYTEKDLFNPLINEKIGRWYLFDRLPEIMSAKGVPLSLYTLLASYNRGAENVREWFKGEQKGEFHAQPKETQNYVKKIYTDLGFNLEI